MTANLTMPQLLRPELSWLWREQPPCPEAWQSKYLLLDFWTLGCVNCQNTIPVLRNLDTYFGDRLYLIGIHSPKFVAEREATLVSAAMNRFAIDHPVILDSEMILWQAFTIKAWPTLILVDPHGKIRGEWRGEQNFESLCQEIEPILDRPLPKQIRPTEKSWQGTLFPVDPGHPHRFAHPSRLAPFGKSQNWVLSDSGNHQVVVLDPAGAELARFGSGEPGASDGRIHEAGFCHPMGVLGFDQAIIVADRGNHALRYIDLEDGKISTLAGNLGRGQRLTGTQPVSITALANVSALAHAPEGIYFCNSGTHQLGLLDIEQQTIHLIAGSGQEHLLDGLACEAHLAQPQGLIWSDEGPFLYFSDSESSSIRRVHIPHPATVETLCGHGLFESGHRNGDFDRASFQHPEGLLLHGSTLLVADTYNRAVRRLDLENGHVSDLLREDQLPAAEAPFLPVDIVATESEGWLIVDEGRHCIWYLDGHRDEIFIWAS